MEKFNLSLAFETSNLKTIDIEYLKAHILSSIKHKEIDEQASIKLETSINKLNQQFLNTQALNYDWFKYQNPLDEKAIESLEPSLQSITPIIKQLLSNRSNSEINSLITIAAVLDLFAHFESQQSLDKAAKQHISTISDLRQIIELPKSLNLKSKATWYEIFAAYAILQIQLLSLMKWLKNQKLPPEAAELIQVLPPIDVFTVFTMPSIINIHSAITLAEELYKKSTLGKIGGRKSPLAAIKSKLKSAYLNELTQLSNRKAAQELYEHLDADEYKSFKTDYPHETVERWIATWKKEDATSAKLPETDR